MKRSTFIGIFIVSCVGWGLFQLKYEVVRLEQQYKTIRHTIRETHDAIHVLNAEWAHLNDPHRLQQLSEKYLNAAPLKGSQIISFRSRATGNPPESMEDYYNTTEMDQLVSQASQKIGKNDDDELNSAKNPVIDSEDDPLESDAPLSLEAED